MIVIVDFDNTLALGNKSHISTLFPNTELINRLNALKQTINPIIKVVTARGSKSNLTLMEKQNRYFNLIHDWLLKNNVPFDEISFNKEYGCIYIDDMTINQDAFFSGFISEFTQSKIILTETTVIKESKTAPLELEWYKSVNNILKTPKVLFCNDELIITERIKNYTKPTAKDFRALLVKMSSFANDEYNFETYTRNIPKIEYQSSKVSEMQYPIHQGTLFHGDLSTTNVLVTETERYCIDPNKKNIFGSYLTDAGKAYFSLIAYEANFPEAQKLVEYFGEDVLKFAVAEGLRVCKYKPKYISIVNNIADITK